MENSEEARRLHRTASLIGIAVGASLILYLIIAEFLRNYFRPFHGFASLPNLQTLRYVFYALAIGEVIAIRLLQGFLLKRSPGDDARTTLFKLFRTSIATVCLSEVPGFLGLALFLLGGLNKDLYALLAVSMVLVFMYFPRLKSWEDWIARNS